jgi:hypothetical protein
MILAVDLSEPMPDLRLLTYRSTQTFVSRLLVNFFAGQFFFSCKLLVYICHLSSAIQCYAIQYVTVCLSVSITTIKYLEGIFGGMALSTHKFLRGSPLSSEPDPKNLGQI